MKFVIFFHRPEGKRICYVTRTVKDSAINVAGQKSAEAELNYVIIFKNRKKQHSNTFYQVVKIAVLSCRDLIVTYVTQVEQQATTQMPLLCCTTERSCQCMLREL